MADYFVDVTTINTQVLAQSNTRKRSRLINYSDAPIYFAVDAAPYIGGPLTLPPNGGSYAIDRALGTFTNGAINAIQAGPGPKQVGIENEEWGVNDGPPLPNLAGLSLVDLQSGDAVMFDNVGQGHNSPVFSVLDFDLDGGGSALPLGLYRLPREVSGAGTLESVRLYTTDTVGAITVDILAAPFGEDFASVVGSGTKPNIANAADSQWYEDDTLDGWTFDFDPGTWYWIQVTSNSGITSLRVSIAYQRRFAAEVLA